MFLKDVSRKFMNEMDQALQLLQHFAGIVKVKRCVMLYGPMAHTSMKQVSESLNES